MSPGVILVLLSGCLLADGALSGWRVTLGRSARICKTGLVARGMVCGVAWSVTMLSAIAAAALAAGLRVQEVGQALQPVAPYWVGVAAVAILGLGIRCLPGPEAPSLASILVLGPLTFLRPPVFILGSLACLWHGGTAGWPIATACGGALLSDQVVLVAMRRWGALDDNAR